MLFRLEGICEYPIDGKACWLERCTSYCTFSLTFAAAAGEQTTEPPYRVETLATGLKFPWSLAFLPNGDALLTEKFGELRILRENGLDPKWELDRARDTVPGIEYAYSRRADGARWKHLCADRHG